MIHTKQDLRNKIKNLSELYLELGLKLRNLVYSLEHYKDDYTLKEQKEQVKPLLNKCEENKLIV